MEYYLALSITLGWLICIPTLGWLLYSTKNDAIRQAEAQNLTISRLSKAIRNLANLYDQAIHQNGENPEKTGKRLLGEMRGRMQQRFARNIDFNDLLAYLRDMHNITPAYFAAMSDDERQAIEATIYFEAILYFADEKWII